LDKEHISYSRNILEAVLLHKLHNEELNDLYSSPNIVRVIKSRRIEWAKHVARMGKRRSIYRFWVEKPEGREEIIIR